MNKSQFILYGEWLILRKNSEEISEKLLNTKFNDIPAKKIINSK